MSTPLANPRRTKLTTWPGTRKAAAEQPADPKNAGNGNAGTGKA
jgi:hypothetical protein